MKFRRLCPLLSALILLGLPVGRSRAADDSKKVSETDELFLNLSKVNLGTVKTEEDKKKYLYTIQLEKARITRKTLQAVYDNAHDLYVSGDYEGARELTGKILSIDPGYEDAVILQRAAVQLQGTNRPYLSEQQFVQRKFDEGMDFYRHGRLAEAAQRLEETVKLAPSNLKAMYWLRKVRSELADEHFHRGETAYQQHRLREALDQWYEALVLNPHYPRLLGIISKVETELRQGQANDQLQTALQLYSQGKSDESLKVLEQALQTQPGDPKAQRLMSEIRSEMANQYVSEGRRLYGLREYTGAINAWRKAADYGYEADMIEQLVGRAKEQMRREEEAKKQEEEEAKKREEEAKKKAEEDAKKAQEQKNAQAAGQAAGSPTTGAGYMGPAGVTEENRQNAVTHWNQGIIFFQKGDLDRARDEWILCKQLDPTNSDCLAGLQRIDQQLGGP